MFITMLADFTAFAQLVFGYFFYWTIHEDFPPSAAKGPGVFWPSLAAGTAVGRLGADAARRADGTDRRPVVAFYLGLLAACALAAGGRRGAPRRSVGHRARSRQATSIPRSSGCWRSGRRCTLVVGVIMQVYCLARRLAGRMTARHDIDITNVALYWHFAAITVVITVAVIAGFPLVK